MVITYPESIAFVRPSSPIRVNKSATTNAVMQSAFVFTLLLVSLFAFAHESQAFPSDMMTSSTTMATATATTKEVKEPKDIKDAATASKDVKDAIKNARKNKKECAKDCGSLYDPVCAHDPADTSFKPRTFGTQCALDIHNCEMGTKLAVKSKGECPGSGGVRL